MEMIQNSDFTLSIFRIFENKMKKAQHKEQKLSPKIHGKKKLRTGGDF